MKKIIFSAIILLALLLSGCGESSPMPNEETGHSPENTEASPVGGDIAEEDNAPETSSETAVTVASTAAPDGGVVLSEPEYKKLMNMVTFDGEFVNLSDIGAEVTINEIALPLTDKEYRYAYDGCDGGLIYYDAHTVAADDSECVMWEYNTETKESTEIWRVKNSYIRNADKDYIVLVNFDETYYYYSVYIRKDGREVELPMFEGGNLVRRGKSFYYNYSDSIYSEQHDRSFDVRGICKFSPETGQTELMFDGAYLYAGNDLGLCVGKDGLIYYADPTSDGALKKSYDFSANMMDMAGMYPTYTFCCSSDVLGDKYEVGYFPFYSLRKTLLRTQYKTNVYLTAVAENEAAAVVLNDGTSDEMSIALIDTANKTAALIDGLPAVTALVADGNYIHYISFEQSSYVSMGHSSPEDGKMTIVTINTSDMCR